ncbi:hypothetical protein PFISCL1PPCAC_15965, partial [Pristionchus fissidentatus]
EGENRLWRGIRESDAPVRDDHRDVRDVLARLADSERVSSPFHVRGRLPEWNRRDSESATRVNIFSDSSIETAGENEFLREIRLNDARDRDVLARFAASSPDSSVHADMVLSSDSEQSDHFSDGQREMIETLSDAEAEFELLAERARIQRAERMRAEDENRSVSSVPLDDDERRRIMDEIDEMERRREDEDEGEVEVDPIEEEEENHSINLIDEIDREIGIFNRMAQGNEGEIDGQEERILPIRFNVHPQIVDWNAEDDGEDVRGWGPFIDRRRFEINQRDVSATRNRIREMRDINQQSESIALRYSRNCGIC